MVSVSTMTYCVVVETLTRLDYIIIAIMEGVSSAVRMPLSVRPRLA